MNGPAARAGPSPFETAAVRGLLRVTVIVECAPRPDTTMHPEIGTVGAG